MNYIGLFTGLTGIISRLPCIKVSVGNILVEFLPAYEIDPDIVYHCAAWTAVDAAEDAGGDRVQGERPGDTEYSGRV